jgi:NhaA family Na+:H+ antiporter
MTPARPYLSRGRFSQIATLAEEVVHGDEQSQSARVAKLQRFRHAARETIAPVDYLEHLLHPWVAFAVMPIFALVNAAVPLSLAGLTSPIALALVAGLAIGKPLGIVAASWIAVRLRLASLPEGVSWRLLFAGGCLAGIGFTMALFIASLALGGPLLENAKLGVLAASAASAAIGLSLLWLWSPKAPQPAA